ncbi:MAG: response regulator [Methylobacter sp.]
MPIPLSLQYLKRYFLSSLGIIVSVIGIAETLVMLLLDETEQQGFALSRLQNTLLDSVLLIALTAPLLWFLALRPLKQQIIQKQIQVDEQAASNRELLEALENHVLVSIADTQGSIVYANDMFCKVSGYARDELVGQDHRIVNSGYHDMDYIRGMWRTIAQGQVWRGEFCNRRKDGTLYWVDSTIAPLLDNQGKPKQYISIRRDITQQKTNEQKLAALKRALDASSEMILITDDQGHIEYANPALCQFTGWPKEELLGQKPSVFDSPNSDRQALAELQSKLRSSSPWSGRLRGRRRETSIVDSGDLEYWAKTNVTPILTATGALTGYVQIQHDVSKQVEQEAAQQIESEDTAARLEISETLHQSLPLPQRFAQALEILSGLRSFDRQRKGCIYLRVQDDYLEKFDTDASYQCAETRIAFGEGLCGQTAVTKKPVIAGDCTCGNDQRHGHYVMPITSGDETLGVLFAYTEPNPIQSDARIQMLKEVGEMLALALLQHQAHASLEAARDEALQLAHTKTEFLANMSHEIRTPMNGVLGMLDLLQDTQLTREQWDLLQIAASSAESLLTVINDILDFSKLEAGKIELEQIEFNLPELVEEVCTLLSSRAHSKGLELNCFLPTRLPKRWRGDPTRIRQVLTNLIGNAVKFTEKGEVSVKVSLSNNDTVSTPILRFEVADTGIGISAETQARLFQAFSQADSSTSRRYGGTGLGLSISKDLVRLMNGNIGVESALGHGATFWFTLPLLPMEDAIPTPPANFTRKRVLIVDDNATNRMILAHHLNNWGFSSHEADRGPAALAELEAAVARGEPYDLLLSDMQMPDMDGFALARAIRAIPAIADTPRILLSSGGIGSEEDRRQSGFAQSLLKPVRQSQLFDAISDALKLSEQKAVVAAPSIEISLNYSGNKVLVVEDNKVNQKVILAQLAKFQLKPDVAGNGEIALERLAQQTYDLVFMDCQMPVMDGYEATRILREREINTGGKTRTPVVALTAHASVGEREKCLSAGMDDYLSKPASRSDLAEVLERWVSSPSISATADAEPVAVAPLLPEQYIESSAALNKNWDETAALKRLGDDHELLSEMIDLFLEEAPVQLAELAAALSRTDLPALADAAHAIKGMAGHFCADRVIGSAVTLEQAARNATETDFHELTDDLTRSATELVEMLQHRKVQN